MGFFKLVVRSRRSSVGFAVSDRCETTRWGMELLRRLYVRVAKVLAKRSNEKPVSFAFSVERNSGMDALHAGEGGGGIGLITGLQPGDRSASMPLSRAEVQTLHRGAPRLMRA